MVLSFSFMALILLAKYSFCVIVHTVHLPNEDPHLVSVLSGVSVRVRVSDEGGGSAVGGRSGG
jgi:hypothetical protein